MTARSLGDITVEDLVAHPVWEMIEGSTGGDVLVMPVRQLPVRTMRNRLAGTKLQLADGTTLWGLLGNVAPKNPRSTKHFLTVSIHRDGKWFDLARYHDVDFRRRDGVALAGFLGKQIQDIFPIAYDLTSLVIGLKESLAANVEQVPDERLDGDELINLSMQGD